MVHRHQLWTRIGENLAKSNIFEQNCNVLHGINKLICSMLDNVKKTKKILGIAPQFAGDAFTPNGPLVLLLLENSKGYLH